ncbi:hypothetical protein [Mycoplasma crocodyli]|uniref:hypothetical protein n=1 Tax=Mycoplasma crocodyli TaxID=50052 RepID=UPI0011D0B66D|nr:hypothetical protein [Mycoplasma crocodyli]
MAYLFPLIKYLINIIVCIFITILYSTINIIIKKNVLKSVLIGFLSIFILLTPIINKSINISLNHNFSVNNDKKIKIYEKDKSNTGFNRLIIPSNNDYKELSALNIDFDLINNIYKIPSILINKSIYNTSDVLKLDNYNYSSLILEEKSNYFKLKEDSDYFIYRLSDEPIFLKNNDELVNIIKKHLEKLDILDIDILNIKKFFSNKSAEINELTEGSKQILNNILSSTELQYILRDWNFIAKNNQLIIEKLEKSLSFTESNLWSILTKNSNNIFVYNFLSDNFNIKNIIPLNTFFSKNKPINKEDLNFISSQLIKFSNDEIYVLNKNENYDLIDKEKFNEEFEHIKEQNDWIKFIESKGNKYSNINDLLDVIYSFDSNVKNIKLSPNESMSKYYNKTIDIEYKITYHYSIITYVSLFFIGFLLRIITVIKIVKKGVFYV